MNRKSELEELAKKLSELEKKYQITIISDNGHTNALIVDQISGHDYHYIRGKGKISHYHDCCCEEL